MRLIVPDAALLIGKYVRSELTEFDELNPGCAEAETQASKLREILWAGHQTIYDYSSISLALTKAGFAKVVRQGFNSTVSPQMKKEAYDLLPTISLYVEAVK